MSRDGHKLHPAISWLQINIVEQLHDYWAVACIKKTLIKHNWLWIVLTAFIVLITKVSEVCWKQKLPSAICGNWIVLKILQNLFCSCCKSLNYWSLWGLLADRSSLPFSFPVSKERHKTASPPPENTTVESGNGNNTSVCHALGVSLCHQQGAGAGDSYLLRNREIQSYTSKNTHIYGSLLGLRLFSKLKSGILTGTWNVNSDSWPCLGSWRDKICHRSLWLHYQTLMPCFELHYQCPALNLWTLKMLFTISQMWDFKCGTWGPASDTNGVLLFIS